MVCGLVAGSALDAAGLPRIARGHSPCESIVFVAQEIDLQCRSLQSSVCGLVGMGGVGIIFLQIWGGIAEMCSLEQGESFFRLASLIT